MNIVKLFIIAVISSSLLSGCVSLQDMIQSKINPKTGLPLHYIPVDFEDKQERKLDMIANANVEEMELVYKHVYKPQYPNSNFDISYERVSKKESEFKISWESEKGFFPSGVYDINRTRTHNSREPVAFIDFVMAGIGEMVGNVENTGVQYQLHAYYSGQADGVPIGKNGLLYIGEYGDILIAKERATLNGKPHAFSIEINKSVSNSELAALRAYSLKNFVDQMNLPINIEDHYMVTVTNEIGSFHRFVQLVLKIKTK